MDCLNLINWLIVMKRGGMNLKSEKSREIFNFLNWRNTLENWKTSRKFRRWRLISPYHDQNKQGHDSMPSCNWRTSVTFRERPRASKWYLRHSRFSLRRYRRHCQKFEEDYCFSSRWNSWPSYKISKCWNLHSPKYKSDLRSWQSILSSDYPSSDIRYLNSPYSRTYRP
jgi:hypothetical protein